MLGSCFKSEIRDKKVWATLSSLVLFGALSSHHVWRIQRLWTCRFLSDSTHTALPKSAFLFNQSNCNFHVTDTDRSISRGREAFVGFP